jgi:hypothetical protein
MKYYFSNLEFKNRYFLKFDQIYLSKPTNLERDGTTSYLRPNEARIRNLTLVYSNNLKLILLQIIFNIRYSAPLNVDLTQRIIKQRTGETVQKHEKISIGKIPIMLKSYYCLLHGLNDRDLSELNECPLEVLDLSSNEIKYLGKYCFVRLDNLRELNLNMNKLNQIESKLFIRFHKLEVLNLSSNEISLSKCFFTNVNKCTSNKCASKLFLLICFDLVK